MKVIIAGGRHIMDPHVVEQAMQHCMPGTIIPTEVVSGGATGVDEMGENWAKARGIPIKTFPADWKRHGHAAGPIRNGQMASYATMLVAIWDGRSRGTGNMIEQMRSLNKLVFIWRV